MPTHTTRDGARIHYRIQGQGRPPLIFIHGWCSNLRHWDPQARHFGRKHQVLRADRRGMGRSTTPGSGQNPSQHARDLAAIARAEKLRGAIVVGHAGGGPTALEFARSYPRIARALVMVDSQANEEVKVGDAGSPFGATLGQMIDTLESPGGAAAFRQIYRGFFGPKADRKLVAAAVAEATRTPIPVAVAELRSLARDNAAVARELTQPVLWLTANPVDQAALRELMPKVSFAQVVGSGHFPQLETPGQVNAMIDTFIAQL